MAAATALAAGGGGQPIASPLELLVFRCEVGEATTNAAGAGGLGEQVKPVKKQKPMGDDQTPKR